jgi:plasmid maintenance system killer protein
MFSRLDRAIDAAVSAGRIVDDVRARRIPYDHESRLFRKLQMLDDAVTDRDLRTPPTIISRSCGAIWPGSIQSA